MIRRTFYVALGVTVGILAMRQVRRAGQALAPNAVASGVSDRARGFAADVRVHMAEREGELRAALGLDAATGAPARPVGPDTA